MTNLRLSLYNYFRSGLLGGTSFSTKSLFANGEQGVWYDPSDLSTMFQDSAGTTPAVVGQPVGRIEDKSGRGNHAIQSTVASKPVLARHPVGGRRNLLTYTEDFGNGVWIKNSSSIAGNTLSFGAASSWKLEQNISPVAPYGSNVTLAIEVRVPSGSRLIKAHVFDNVSGTRVSNDINVTTSWQRVNFSAPIDATASSVVVGLRESINDTSAGSLEVRFPQLETGSTATPYQKVVSQYDVTEAGKDDCYYLAFDGVDDFLSTAAIDFTGTDEMSVFAGVRKLSDVAAGVAVELSTNSETQNGAFGIRAPNGASASLAYFSRGTTFGYEIEAAVAAPLTAVLVGLSDVSDGMISLRRDGADVAGTLSADQGTGNYGNYPLYIGRRGGTSLAFNGNLYGLIVRGKLTEGDELTRVEEFIADKTGVTF